MKGTNKNITNWCTLLSAIFLFTILSTQAMAQDDTSTTTATTTLPTLVQTEAAVRSYFAQIPAMISIAKCESGFRQYTSNGTPLHNHQYVGVFQIDENIHADFASSLGMDIYTLDGNLAYAKNLYDNSGTKPWAGCVKNTNPVLTLNLKLGDTNSQVKTLQQILNNAGFTVAKSGPGSAGKESTTFGSMTKKALQRFQCAKKIVCQGSESSTGYGTVGPRTKALLLQTAKTE
ncbi:MAG: peptidoglycan-binding protein [Patescibacteria group bacterium]